MAGVYDGVTNVGKLKEYGDFGLGTIDKLDGEMVNAGWNSLPGQDRWRGLQSG